jgi:hypothetical protein
MKVVHQALEWSPVVFRSIAGVIVAGIVLGRLCLPP